MARTFQTNENEKTLIKQIMRDKGITIEQLAERMGKARPTISNLLIKQNMTIDTLTAFAEALEVNVADLFPVNDGYVHYSEKRKRIMGSIWGTEQKEQQTAPTTGHFSFADEKTQPAQTTTPAAQPTIQTTAFCPHCGAKVRIGVVLIEK